MKVDNLLQKLISFLFAGLFFLLPLFFTSVNSELFEFNKTILLYLFTILITSFWLARILWQKKIIFKRTYFDLPLFLFFASQIASTIFSIDRHTSIFGYYSRFNGSLLSIICYILLYWAFVSNCEAKDVFKAVRVSLVSAAIISLYGILEHFGHSFSCLLFTGSFDVNCWIQKVQERVFATLGQPNWLAAYLTTLMPISWTLILNSNIKNQISKLHFKIKSFLPFILSILFFLCLLFTQSKSGFLGFILSFAIFLSTIFYTQKNDKLLTIKLFLFLIFTFCVLIFLYGSPFPQINKYFSLQSLKSRFSSPASTSNLTPLTSQSQPSNVGPLSSDDGGISTSSDIRKIVWKGAINIFKHYPWFGSGVETFAYSYYNFRPVEHNLVSEWEFLYNKAHNEYLNYLSTTGIFGLGSYLLLIIFFVTWSIIQFKVQSSKFKIEGQNSKLDRQKPLTFNCYFELLILNFALFSGWLSILVTNFFGFSVVVTSLYFFLIPAFCVVLSHRQLNSQPTIHSRPTTHNPSIFLFIPLILACLFLIIKTVNYWRADFFYSRAQKQVKLAKYPEAYQNLYRAKNLFANEPVYLSELASVTANLAVVANESNEISASEELKLLAVNYSDQAKKISPNNLNILKNRVRVFYILSTIQPDYLQKAIDSMFEAINLSPTDPKLVYNLGLLYAQSGNIELAMQIIQKSLQLKPNYVDARNALSLFYEQTGEKDKALEQLLILKKLAPENATEFQKRIDKLK